MKRASEACVHETPTEPSSKKQRKKLEKEQKKKYQKLMHQENIHGSMLASARTLRAAFQRSSTAVADSDLYESLRHAGVEELFASWRDSEASPLIHRTAEPVDGHSLRSQASAIVERFLWRPPLYNEKYASQEFSLLFQLFRLGAQSADLVLDVGGGNANLSCLIALALDVPVICVEMESPRAELRGEAWLPARLQARGAVRRVESLIQDFVLPEGYHNVLVLGKHLCGPGTYAGIDFVRRHLDRVLGCAFATCCCCKLVGGSGRARRGNRSFLAPLLWSCRGANRRARCRSNHSG